MGSKTDIGKNQRAAIVPIVERKIAFCMMRKEKIPRYCPNKLLKYIYRIQNQYDQSPMSTDVNLLDITLLLRNLILVSIFSILMLFSKVDPMGIPTN